MKYRYEIDGTAAQDQTWKMRGFVETDRPGQFLLTPNLAVGKAFAALTEGKAVYGKPGLGCQGPYGITRMLIEETK